MIEPRFKRDDRVHFIIMDGGNEREVTGSVWIVDRYGYFFDNTKPYYDVMGDDGIFYKHIPDDHLAYEHEPAVRRSAGE